MLRLVIATAVAAALVVSSLSSSWLVAPHGEVGSGLRIGPLILWDCEPDTDWTFYTRYATDSSAESCQRRSVGRLLEWTRDAAQTFVGFGRITGGLALIAGVALFLAGILRRRWLAGIAAVGAAVSLVTAIVFVTYVPSELTPHFGLGAAFWIFVFSTVATVAYAFGMRPRPSAL